ncbi:MAG: murein biosynthesis integral membrane protein MurJ, partial [Micrococcales bacterium]|nr:murein biosynthesis integral membrane protein MurJ [Micrococcales bacterium]
MSHSGPSSAAPLPNRNSAKIVARNSGGSVGRASALMSSGTLVSRVLGALRGVVLAAAIGATGQVADAFSVANKLPNILYLLLAGGALNAVLVPQVVRAYRRHVGQEYVDRLLTFGFTVLAGITVVLTIGSPLLVRLYADPCSQAQVALATTFAYWCVPEMFFYGAYALLGQVLNARGSFGPYMWAPVVNNIVSIAGFGLFIVMFGHSGGDASTWGAGKIFLLAGTATFGIVTQAAVLLPALRLTGVHFTLRWGLRGSGLGRAGTVAIWTFLGLAVGQLGYIVVSRVASAAPGAAGVAVGLCDTAHTGIAGNAAYDYAYQVFMLPHSLITTSLITALFTRMAGQAASGDKPAVRASLSTGLRAIALTTIFAAALVGVLAYPVVRLFLWTSQPDEIAAVGGVVIAMVIGLPAFGAWSMFQRVYYAYEDARAMVPVQIVMAVVVVVGTLLARAVVPPRWWVAGAGLAMSISYLIGALLAVPAMRRRIDSIDGPRVVRVHVQAAVAAVVSIVVGEIVLHPLGASPAVGVIGSLLRCAVVGFVMT